MIVKIQRSITSSDKIERILIYNKDRSVEYETEMFPEIKELFNSNGCPLKIYASAELKNSILVIDKVVPLQEW